MQCPECGTTIESETGPCPECGAESADASSSRPRRSRAASAPRFRRVHAGFALALVVLFVVAFAAVLLMPAGPRSAPPSPGGPAGPGEPTRSVDSTRTAIEQAIRGFYTTVDAGESVTISPYVYPKGLGGVAPAQTESTATTTFSIARAVVGTGTADVYGRESRSVVATGSAEVEFRLRLVDRKWLISSWQVAREPTTTPGALALSEATARDIVGTALEARQAGDATTLRMLTSERFQLAHTSWFDGADQSALLRRYRITGATRKGARYAVTAVEEWLPTPLTTTYTVVMDGGEILVDAWSWK